MSGFWTKIKNIAKQPTSYLGTGFVSVAIEQIANNNATSATWFVLLTGIIGIFKDEKGIKTND